MEEIMKDYYKILQVAPDASTEVIQMAYKALAKKYHPDLNPGQEEAAFFTVSPYSHLALTKS